MAEMVMVAVAAPLNETQHTLRTTEVSPDLADVHVLLALYSTTASEELYEAPSEKFRSVFKPTRCPLPPSRSSKRTSWSIVELLLSP